MEMAFFIKMVYEWKSNMKADEAKFKQLTVFSLGDPGTLAVNDSFINEKQQGTSGLLTDYKIIWGY